MIFISLHDPPMVCPSALSGCARGEPFCTAVLPTSGGWWASTASDTMGASIDWGYNPLFADSAAAAGNKIVLELDGQQGPGAAKKKRPPRPDAKGFKGTKRDRHEEENQQHTPPTKRTSRQEVCAPWHDHLDLQLLGELTQPVAHPGFPGARVARGILAGLPVLHTEGLSRSRWGC
jgi:hypothetical protein